MGSEGEEALVSCGTSKGPVVMRMHRDWSPQGYDRVVDLFERVRVAFPCLSARTNQLPAHLP
jgi:hypothetical protein